MTSRQLHLLGCLLIALAAALLLVGALVGWQWWLTGVVAPLGGVGGAIIGMAWRRRCIDASGRWKN